MSWFYSKSVAVEQAETTVWKTAIPLLAGSGTGSVSSGDVALADALIVQLKTRSSYGKIKYLAPMVGTGVKAARMPLIDVLAVGGMGNANFGDSDQSALGLQGGESRIMNLNFKANQLGTSGNGGLGYWENNISFAGNSTDVCGSYSNDLSQRYNIDLRANLQLFGFGHLGGGNYTSVATTGINAHYYGQKSSSSAYELFRDATSIASTNAGDGSQSGIEDQNIFLMGAQGLSWFGRCAVFYATDGTLTGQEITDLHADLGTYLITPTGR